MGIDSWACVVRNFSNNIFCVHCFQFGHLHGARAKRLILVVGIMAAHAIGEGCGVGVSFCGDEGLSQGILTTLAIGVHNIPEGLAKATVLVSQGATAGEAFFWSILTCLPQPVMAIPSYIFVNTFSFLLPIALGFAAGCMIWMVFAELLPDALKDAEPAQVASAATISAAALEGLRMAFEHFDAHRDEISSPTGFSIYGKLIPLISSTVSLAGGGAMFGFLGALIFLPVPVLLGLMSILLGSMGSLPLASSLFTPSKMPLLHIFSAAVAGGTSALILRRHVILSTKMMFPKKMDMNAKAKTYEDDQIESGVGQADLPRSIVSRGNRSDKGLASNKFGRNSHMTGFNKKDIGTNNLAAPMKLLVPLRSVGISVLLCCLFHSIIAVRHDLGLCTHPNQAYTLYSPP